MSADHLACSTSVWNDMPAKHRAIIDTAMDALALKTMMRVLVDNGEAKAMLPAKGVTFYNWSEEDRATFRAAAKDAWDDWAKKTPETAAIVESHKAFIKRIGLGG